MYLLLEEPRLLLAEYVVLKTTGYSFINSLGFFHKSSISKIVLSVLSAYSLYKKFLKYIKV